MVNIMRKKALALFCFVFACCESLFAIVFHVVDESSPEYEKSSILLNKVDSLKGFVALRVSFDGCLDNVTFCSQSTNKVWGCVSPAQDGQWEQNVKSLLIREGFRFNAFHNALAWSKLLCQKGKIVCSDISSLISMLAELERKYPLLIEPHDKITLKYFLDCESTRKDAIELLNRSVDIIRCHELIKELEKKGIVGLEESNPFFREIKEIQEKISSYERGEANRVNLQTIVTLMHQDPPSIAPLEVFNKVIQYQWDDEQISTEFQRLFCRHFMAEAEDAVIYTLLSNMKELGTYYNVPSLIEIYGSKDPCFQCQFKLQWLVNHLVAQTGKPLRISYYSRNEYKGACLVTGCEGKEKVTRSPENIGKLLRLDFVPYKDPASVLAFDVPSTDIGSTSGAPRIDKKAKSKGKSPAPDSSSL